MREQLLFQQLYQYKYMIYVFYKELKEKDKIIGYKTMGCSSDKNAMQFPYIVTKRKTLVLENTNIVKDKVGKPVLSLNLGTYVHKQ